jgi:hypothetical protein
MTTKEKLEAYIWVYDEIKLGHFIYICNGLLAWLRRYLKEQAPTYKDLVKFFPEMLEYKPEDKSIANAWWPSDERDKRIRVLEEIIEKLENMLPVEE